MQINRWLLFSLALLCLSACKDECREYSDFNCKQIQEADYNVYFYFPDEREYFLGKAQGLSNCGSIAWAYAEDHKVTNANWSYICCMIAKGSQCYEKHR
jgi:hypothetical protein